MLTIGLLAVLFIDSALAACSSHSLHPHPLHDHLARPDLSLWTRNNTPNLAVCGALCVDDDLCVTLQYSDGQRSCVGYSSSLEIVNTLETVSANGYRTYLLSEAIGKHGSRCGVAGDCTVVNSQCSQGVCACLDGYHFLSSTGQCEAEPSECNQFNIHYNTSVFGVPAMEVVTVNNLMECLDECIGECQAIVYEPERKDCSKYIFFFPDLVILQDSSLTYAVKNQCD